MKKRRTSGTPNNEKKPGTRKPVKRQDSEEQEETPLEPNNMEQKDQRAIQKKAHSTEKEEEQVVESPAPSKAGTGGRGHKRKKVTSSCRPAAEEDEQATL